MEAIVLFDGVGKKERYEVRRSMVEVGEEKDRTKKGGGDARRSEKSHDHLT